MLGPIFPVHNHIHVVGQLGYLLPQFLYSHRTAHLFSFVPITYALPFDIRHTRTATSPRSYFASISRTIRTASPCLRPHCSLNFFPAIVSSSSSFLRARTGAGEVTVVEACSYARALLPGFRTGMARFLRHVSRGQKLSTSCVCLSPCTYQAGLSRLTIVS